MPTNSTTIVDLHESRAGKVATMIILCPALAAVSVALRVYTRFVLGKRRFTEDYFIVLAMLSSTAMSVCMGISVLNGFGRHVQTVSSKEITEQLKVGIAGIQFYLFSHLFVWLAIMLQYVRLSVMPFEKRLCYTIIAILVIQILSASVIHLKLCTPFAALWNRHLPGAKCLNTTTTYTVTLSLVIAMDFAILILPAPILKHLTLRWYQKLAIAIVLSFGSLACIVSALRLTSLRASGQSKDITWDKVPSAYYGVIEINAGIVCSCIPTLKPLFQRYIPCLAKCLDGMGVRHVSSFVKNSSHTSADSSAIESTEANGQLRSETEMDFSTSKSSFSRLKA